MVLRLALISGVAIETSVKKTCGDEPLCTCFTFSSGTRMVTTFYREKLRYYKILAWLAPVFFFIAPQVIVNFSGALRAPDRPELKVQHSTQKIYHFWTFHKIDPEISPIFFEIFHNKNIFFEKNTFGLPKSHYYTKNEQ